MKQTMAGLMLAFAIAGGVGCGGPQKPKTPAGPTCADVGANLHAQMIAAAKDSGMDMTAFATAARETVLERCPVDGWSAEAIACLAKATAEDMEACSKLLTPAQNQALATSMKARSDAMPEGERGMMKQEEPSMAPPPAGSSAPGDGADPCGGDE